MFFVLSKIFGVMIRPSSLLVLGVVLMVLLGGRFKKMARVAVVVLLAFFVLPLGDWAAYPFEQRAANVKNIPKKIDGIVVLAGGVDPYITAQYDQPAFNAAGDRAALVPVLMRRYPNARVVYTGGSGHIFGQERREADAAKQYFRDAGLDMQRIMLERDSRNTHENAVFSKKLAAPKPGETWLLVTSALHMKRSVAIFERVGWPVAPYAVDFRARQNPPVFCFCMTHNLWTLDALMHEFAGYMAYKITGRI